MSAVRVALAVLAVVAPSSALAACADDIREFALLASMDMPAEATAAYRKLLPACANPLAAQAGGKARLPRAAQRDQVVALGKRIHQSQRSAHAQSVGQTLAAADVPQVDTESLRGIGVENAAQAFGAMSLDIAAAGLQSSRRYAQAGRVQRLADQVRGNEPRAGGVTGGATGGATGGGVGGAMGGAAAPPQPQIPLDPRAVEQASCQGNLGFLEPQLRAYRDPGLSSLRRQILTESIPGMIGQARREGLTKERAISAARQQGASHDDIAAQAAATANQSDGQGSVSIPQAVSDRLPLDFPCQGAAVHASGVCAFIQHRWASLTMRASAALLQRCWGS